MATAESFVLTSTVPESNAGPCRGGYEYPRLALAAGEPEDMWSGSQK